MKAIIVLLLLSCILWATPNKYSPADTSIQNQIIKITKTNETDSSDTTLSIPLRKLVQIWMEAEDDNPYYYEPVLDWDSSQPDTVAVDKKEKKKKKKISTGLLVILIIGAIFGGSLIMID